jgi:hypothetical protein
VNVKNKPLPVTGRGGPYGCVTSRLVHFLDNQLTDGSDIVDCYLREDSWYSFELD